MPIELENKDLPCVAAVAGETTFTRIFNRHRRPPQKLQRTSLVPKKQSIEETRWRLKFVSGTSESPSRTFTARSSFYSSFWLRIKRFSSGVNSRRSDRTVTKRRTMIERMYLFVLNLNRG